MLLLVFIHIIQAGDIRKNQPSRFESGLMFVDVLVASRDLFVKPLAPSALF